MCVYYCRTYYKAVCGVCLLLQYSRQKKSIFSSFSPSSRVFFVRPGKPWRCNSATSGRNDLRGVASASSVCTNFPDAIFYRYRTKWCDTSWVRQSSQRGPTFLPSSQHHRSTTGAGGRRVHIHAGISRQTVTIRHGAAHTQALLWA